MNKFFLPQIEKISIHNYSLYHCPLEINFSSKLNIIYGTNGTGKSTLLMMLLFSIVGPYRGGIKTKFARNNVEITAQFMTKASLKIGQLSI